jgi:hypothetical protein
MASVPVWPGSSSFFPGETPFGFYDHDYYFQQDADRVAKYAATRLGYPLVDIELQAANFYTAFEEAITEYGSQVYQFKIRDNYQFIEGSSTGSNLEYNLTRPSMAGSIRIAQQYGTEAGSGGNVDWKTGSIDITAEQQDYDLQALWGNVSESGKRIEIKQIYHYAPPGIVRYFDPYAGTGTGMMSLMDQMGFGNFSPGIAFLMMPIYFDVLRLQAIEFNDQIRKSAYSFEVVNNKLRIFPIPRDNTKLHFRYIVEDDRNSPILYDGNGNAIGGVVTDYSNVPYDRPIYKYINGIGKQWVFRYAAALAKETLGNVRSKYGTIPIPGETITLDGATLRTEAQAEKEKLIVELRETLGEVSRTRQLEKQNQEADFLNSTLSKVPLPIYIG